MMTYKEEIQSFYISHILNISEALHEERLIVEFMSPFNYVRLGVTIGNNNADYKKLTYDTLLDVNISDLYNGLTTLMCLYKYRKSKKAIIHHFYTYKSIR